MNCHQCKDNNFFEKLYNDFDKCHKCKIYRKSPLISRQELKRKMSNMMLSATRDSVKEAQRIKNAEDQIDILERYVSSSTRRVYDVGAAAGFFLKVAREHNWEVHGNDISHSAIKWAKDRYDLDIDYGYYDELRIEKDYYDAVVMWNTLEHLHEPLDAIKIAYDSLKSKGLIYIKLPYIMDDEFLKTHYETYHLTEFNADNLVSMVKSVGFKIKMQTIPLIKAEDYAQTLLAVKE